MQNVLTRCFPLLAILLGAMLLAAQTIPVLAATPQLQTREAISDPELSRLRRGEVVVVENPKKATQSTASTNLTAKVLIDRPVTQVWEIVSDQPSMFRAEPRMKKVRVVSKNSPSQELVEYTLALSKLLPPFVYTTRVNYQKPNKAVFKRVSGSFKDFEGSCQLLPFDGGKRTLMVYNLAIDPGMIPDVLVRNFLRGDLPSLLSHVKTQVHQNFPPQKELATPKADHAPAL